MKIAKLTKDLMPKVIGLTAGSVGGAMADKFLAGKVNPFILNGGKIALGAIVGSMMGKNKIVSSIGDGLIAQGGAGLALQLLPKSDDTVEGFNDNAIGADDEVIVDTYSQDVSGVDEVTADNAIGDMFTDDEIM